MVKKWCCSASDSIYNPELKKSIDFNQKDRYKQILDHNRRISSQDLFLERTFYISVVFTQRTDTETLIKRVQFLQVRDL